MRSGNDRNSQASKASWAAICSQHSKWKKKSIVAKLLRKCAAKTMSRAEGQVVSGSCTLNNSRKNGPSRRRPASCTIRVLLTSCIYFQPVDFGNCLRLFNVRLDQNERSIKLDLLQIACMLSVGPANDSDALALSRTRAAAATAKRQDHVERRSRPRSTWTREDIAAEVALVARQGQRHAVTRLIWGRVTQNAPQWVQQQKEERIRENIAYFFRFQLTLRRLFTVMRSTRSNLAARELRELGLVSPGGQRVATNAYLLETRARLRGTNGILSFTGQFLSVWPVLEAVVVRNCDFIISTLRQCLLRAGRDAPRAIALQIDGWHPHCWSRVANGPDAVRSRSAVQLSLWLPPGQEFWTSAP